MTNKKILFVTYGGGHAQLIKTLTRNFNENEYKVLALTAAYNIFDKKNVLGIVDVFNSLKEEDKKTVNKASEVFLKQNPDLDVKINRETLLYYGIGALDFIKKTFFSELLNFHWKRHLFLQTYAMKRFLEVNSEFQLIVTTTSPRFERASILCAQELSIDNIQIDDMFANPETLFIAEDVIVASDLEKKRLINRGIRNKIHPLGNPILEKFLKTNNSLKNNRTIYFCPHKDRLYDNEGNECFSGNDRENHIREFTFLAKLLKNNPEYNLIVRPHPNDAIDDYNEFKTICKFKIVSALEEKLETALSKAALWISPASTTGIQSCLFGVPTITYTFRDSDVHPTWRMTKEPFIFYNGLEEIEQSMENFSLKKMDNVSQNDWTFLRDSNFRITEFIRSKFNES